MDDTKVKVLIDELQKHPEILKEFFSTASKLKSFKFGMMIGRAIDFQPDDEELDRALEEVKKDIMKGQKKEDKGNTGEEDRKDKKKSENADALYLLDLFEKYVE